MKRALQRILRGVYPRFALSFAHPRIITLSNFSQYIFPLLLLPLFLSSSQPREKSNRPRRGLIVQTRVVSFEKYSLKGSASISRENCPPLRFETI